MTKPARAFVVDDEDMILSICQEALADTFIVETFSTPVLAIKEIELGNKPDVVITDMRMPEMNGVEFLGKLRERGCDMPVIVITGYADRNAAVQCLNLGAFALIDKPFVVSTLILSVNRAAAFQLMRNLSSELLPRYMFLADSLNEAINSHKDALHAAFQEIESMPFDAKNIDRVKKIVEQNDLINSLKAVVHKHEAEVASMHEEEDRLRQLLKVLETRI